GDAEAEAEQDMLAGGADLAAQVLKAGHHGSSTSSSEAFLRAVQPQIAVISAGKDNSYGHPHREVLERLTSLGVEILRTDLAGDIVITADRQGIVAVATAVQ
ncbi:MAG TPA: MBL fold metallo-hydrolase, partial [Clostridia bacterium]|nr:MBL fold metallo-hydrolase [Clostridia bacterium]